jgi:hypothetical protein
MTVQITRLDHDADALREHAAGVGEANVARRLLALALVLEGRARAAAKCCGMDRQTLRDSVICYNEQGSGACRTVRTGVAGHRSCLSKRSSNSRSGSAKGPISLTMVSCDSAL